jgi:pimeloyl-ACP methyl ester carboxylesterase
MYERVKATPPNIDYPYNYTGPNNAPPEPNMGWVPDPNGFNPDYSTVSWQPTQQYIVFVHGWNTDYNGATTTGETIFKRLWQRGYKGRFVRFYWPTYTGFTTFNDSEYRAWKCGASLQQYMASLPSGYGKDLISHSMGGIVGGSALQKGMSVDNYVLLNAAVPAECFDTNSALNQWNYTTPDGDTDPGTKALGYIGQLSTVSGNLVNFYLTQDSATTYWWPLNQQHAKPQRFNSGASGYFYTPGNPAGQKLGITYMTTVGRFVTTAHEAMAYVDQSETKATGGESRTAGAISGSSDMDNYGFGTDHSAEFNLPIQQVEPCYYDILKNLRIPQIYLDSAHP